MKHGVYRIRNTQNEKCYIGSAAGREGFHRRWREHRNSLLNHHHHSPHLQYAWNKYGESSFVFEILEECIPAICIEREQDYLNTLLFASCNDQRFKQLGYNICRVAGNTLGRRNSEVTRSKISKANKGKKRSLQTKLRIGKAKQGEKHPNARLIECDINDIKMLIELNTTQRVIAKIFGVAQQTISKIKLGKKWSHINEFKSKSCR